MRAGDDGWRKKCTAMLPTNLPIPNETVSDKLQSLIDFYEWCALQRHRSRIRNLESDFWTLERDFRDFRNASSCHNG